MTTILKDLISFFVFVFVTPFYRNRNAVLVYHSVENIDSSNDPFKMNVRPKLFEKHMACLAGRGQRFTVTFDDGFESIYLRAFPLIKKYNLKAGVFVTTEYIDGVIDFDDFFDSRYSPKPMRWDFIKEMSAQGVKIGSHGVRHVNMARLDDKDMRGEASLSKRRIEEMTGQSVESFSYPFGGFGSFNKKTAQILASAGYRKAYTNILGMDNSGTMPLSVRRIRIYGTDNLFRFRMKIAGAYNWVDKVARLCPIYY